VFVAFYLAAGHQYRVLETEQMLRQRYDIVN